MFYKNCVKRNSSKKEKKNQIDLHLDIVLELYLMYTLGLNDIAIEYIYIIMPKILMRKILK